MRLSISVLLIVSSPLFASEPPKGFTPLFNDKNLDGWHGWAIHAKGASPAELERLAPAERKQKLDAWMADAKRHWMVENGELVNDATARIWRPTRTTATSNF